MKLNFRFLAGMVVCIALAACGGGGGDAGGGVGPVPEADPIPPVPLTLSVTINGNAATADGNGEYLVNSDDTVRVDPSQATSGWRSGVTVEGTGPIGQRNPSLNTTAYWSAQLVNETPGIVSFTVTGTASGNASVTASVVLQVWPAAAAAQGGVLNVNTGDTCPSAGTLPRLDGLVPDFSCVIGGP
jgi:hypothetical protein